MSATYTGIKALSLTADRGFGERSYTYTALVVTTGNEGPLAVCSAAGLPVPETTAFQYLSENDQGAVCRKLTPRQVGPTDWEVICQFSTKQADPKTSDPSYTDNPFADPLEITGSPQFHPFSLPYDQDGKHFVASNGEPYDESVAQFDIADLELRVTKNEPYCDFSLWYDYQNSVNADGFYMAPARTARFLVPDFSLQRRAGVAYWQVVYHFLIRAAVIAGLTYSWDTTVLDEGTFYLDGADKRIWLDANKMPTSGKIFLDGEGGLLTSTPEQVYTGAVTPIYNTFRKYKTRDFSALGLG